MTVTAQDNYFVLNERSGFAHGKGDLLPRWWGLGLENIRLAGCYLLTVLNSGLPIATVGHPSSW